MRASSLKPTRSFGDRLREADLPNRVYRGVADQRPGANDHRTSSRSSPLQRFVRRPRLPAVARCRREQRESSAEAAALPRAAPGPRRERRGFHRLRSRDGRAPGLHRALSRRPLDAWPAPPAHRRRRHFRRRRRARAHRHLAAHFRRAYGRSRPQTPPGRRACSRRNAHTFPRMGPSRRRRRPCRTRSTTTRASSAC